MWLFGSSASSANANTCSLVCPSESSPSTANHMSKLILIRSAQTDWQAQGRLAGDTNLQLNEIGHKQAAADALAIAGFSPAVIQCGMDQPTKQTATIIADELQLKTKAMVLNELREIDLGHWEGLTIEDFKERFSKVYRQWRNDPLSVTPPEGESVPEMSRRLNVCLEKVLKRCEQQTVVVVLGHFAFAAARCTLADGNFERFWSYMDEDEQRFAMQVRDVKLTAADLEANGQDS